MVVSTRTMNATCDEVTHLPAGYTYLTWHDFRLNPEHPPLTKALAAMPLLLFDNVSVSRDSEAWRRAVLQPTLQWRFGHDFLYSTPGNDADRLLAHARLAMVALASLLSILLWAWSRELWGDVAAAATVVAWALEPNLLAHGPLVANDVALAIFAFGTAYLLWRTYRAVTVGNVLTLTLCTILAVLSKYSAVFLVPVIATVFAVRVLGRTTWTMRFRTQTFPMAGRAQKAAVAAGLLAAVALAAWTSVWAAAGFTFSAARGTSDRFPLTAEIAALERQATRSGSWQLATAVPLLKLAAEHEFVPEPFIYGFAAMLRDAQNRPSYLLGNVHQGGRWYYFLVAILVKTPLPILLLSSWGGALLLRRDRSMGGRTAELLLVFVTPAVFLAGAMLSRLNLGVRHVLPVYPFLLLLAGFAAAQLLSGRWRRLVAMLAGMWLLVGTLGVFPHFLSYFNEIAGGPRNGVHWLADSNLDWGQDLARLRTWMKRNNVPRINLCYFGNADPSYYGIDFVALPGSWGVWDGRRPANPQLPGYVAISASNLAGVGLPTPELRAYYKRLLERASLVDTIGYSIFLYYVPAT
jgi:hypothetical protein